eukprot:GDKK01003202.1.p1 GENE.GDKK01003202.1~~GDKK01003202.1.p1  ORF type:complete len:118 (+),score=15.80 GDKK01003202.1:42-356(+)
MNDIPESSNNIEKRGLIKHHQTLEYLSCIGTIACNSHEHFRVNLSNMERKHELLLQTAPNPSWETKDISHTTHHSTTNELLQFETRCEWNFWNILQQRKNKLFH